MHSVEMAEQPTYTYEQREPVTEEATPAELGSTSEESRAAVAAVVREVDGLDDWAGYQW